MQQPSAQKPPHGSILCLLVGALAFLFWLAIDRRPGRTDDVAHERVTAESKTEVESSAVASRRDVRPAVISQAATKHTALLGAKETQAPAPSNAVGQPSAPADLDSMIVRLTAEEQALVDKYTVAGLGTAISEMQNAYVAASDATRAEADRRYLLVTNLAAKLAPALLPPSPEALQRQAAYALALPAEQERVAYLAEPARGHALDQFKDDFFKVDLETLPESQELVRVQE